MAVGRRRAVGQRPGRAGGQDTQVFYRLENDHITQLITDAVHNADHATSTCPDHHRGETGVHALSPAPTALILMVGGPLAGTLVGYLPAAGRSEVKARLGWALLLLAAVFSLHGLQCAAAEPVDAAPADHGVVTVETTAVDMTATETTAADGNVSDAPADHSAAVHALMVCLAVLTGGVAVGLAALAAWLARGRTRPAPERATDAVRVVLGRRRSSLPTLDPARLCVLRI